MNKGLILTMIMTAVFSLQAGAQELDLLAELDSMQEPKKEFAMASFKGTRLINGHTIEMPAQGEMIFLISHRFGNLKEGYYNFFGLDQASIRLGFEYTPIDRLCVGIGRSVYQKSVDGFLKYQLLKQASGTKNSSPVSVTLFSSVAVNGLKWSEPERTNYFTSRLSYAHQILIARKVNSNLSLQLMPTMIHYNIVKKISESNDVYALGIGGRYKLTKRLSINAEAYPVLNRNSMPAVNGLQPAMNVALGVDIETGGHVFQLHITNAQAMIEKGFIAESTGSAFDGNIYFGFNISRTFNLH